MIIAFSGASGAGVTVTSFKAAQILYHIVKEKVIYLSLDEEYPTLARLVKAKVKSQKQECAAAISGLEDLLERDSITREGVYRHIYIEERTPNFGILGFYATEGTQGEFFKKTYLEKANAQAFVKVLKEIAPFIFVDCGRRDEEISSYIWDIADKRIVVAEGTPKGIFYYQKHQLPFDATDIWIIQKEQTNKKSMQILRQRFFKERPKELSYCKKLLLQEKEGYLTELLPKNKYVSQVANGLLGVLHESR